jgi:hypothetical protein
MFGRRVVLCCCLGVAIGCTTAHRDRDVVAETCDTATSMGPREGYLGDGTTDYHYYPIVDFLRENPGSTSTTRDVEREERAAAQSTLDLKPPSANIVESEFSHLLGVIARDNGGIGAAVFDTTGLKVGAAGLEMEGLVLAPDRLAALKKAPEDPPLEVHYARDQLRELTQSCAQDVIHGPPCYPLTEFAKDSTAAITVYYRPVIDHQRDSRLLGFSMLVVQNAPACNNARQ